MIPRRWPRMLPRMLPLVLALAATLVGAGCSRGFQLRKYPQNDALFTASLAEYNKKKWGNAITGFEKLTLDLSARDTLLPLAHWYLAGSHESNKEHILAATTFTRLAESFPDDSLADDALFEAGQSYLRLWRNPELDPQYGTLAQVQFRTLLGVYPDSPLRPKVDAALLAIDENFAAKYYLNGLFYVRRGAFDSAIIYFKDAVKDYPNSNHARLALLRMVEVYRRPQMNYKEEAAETCVTLRTAYPTDKDVNLICPAVVAAGADSASTPSSKPATKPPADSGRKSPR